MRTIQTISLFAILKMYCANILCPEPFNSFELQATNAAAAECNEKCAKSRGYLRTENDPICFNIVVNNLKADYDILDYEDMASICVCHYLDRNGETNNLCSDSDNNHINYSYNLTKSDCEKKCSDKGALFYKASEEDLSFLTCHDLQISIQVKTLVGVLEINKDEKIICTCAIPLEGESTAVKLDDSSLSPIILHHHDATLPPSDEHIQNKYKPKAIIYISDNEEGSKKTDRKKTPTQLPKLHYIRTTGKPQISHIFRHPTRGITVLSETTRLPLNGSDASIYRKAFSLEERQRRNVTGKNIKSTATSRNKKWIKEELKSTLFNQKNPLKGVVLLEGANLKNPKNNNQNVGKLKDPVRAELNEISDDSYNSAKLSEQIKKTWNKLKKGASMISKKTDDRRFKNTSSENSSGNRGKQDIIGETSKVKKKNTREILTVSSGSNDIDDDDDENYDEEDDYEISESDEEFHDSDPYLYANSASASSRDPKSDNSRIPESPARSRDSHSTPTRETGSRSNNLTSSESESRQKYKKNTRINLNAPPEGCITILSSDTENNRRIINEKSNQNDVSNNETSRSHSKTSRDIASISNSGERRNSLSNREQSKTISDNNKRDLISDEKIERETKHKRKSINEASSAKLGHTGEGKSNPKLNFDDSKINNGKSPKNYIDVDSESDESAKIIENKKYLSRTRTDDKSRPIKFASRKNPTKGKSNNNDPLFGHRVNISSSGDSYKTISNREKTKRDKCLKDEDERPEVGNKAENSKVTFPASTTNSNLREINLVVSLGINDNDRASSVSNHPSGSKTSDREREISNASTAESTKPKISSRISNTNSRSSHQTQPAKSNESSNFKINTHQRSNNNNSTNGQPTRIDPRTASYRRSNDGRATNLEATSRKRSNNSAKLKSTSHSRSNNVTNLEASSHPRSNDSTNLKTTNPPKSNSSTNLKTANPRKSNSSTNLKTTNPPRSNSSTNLKTTNPPRSNSSANFIGQSARSNSTGDKELPMAKTETKKVEGKRKIINTQAEGTSIEKLKTHNSTAKTKKLRTPSPKHK